MKGSPSLKQAIFYTLSCSTPKPLPSFITASRLQALLFCFFAPYHSRQPRGWTAPPQRRPSRRRSRSVLCQRAQSWRSSKRSPSAIVCPIGWFWMFWFDVLGKTPFLGSFCLLGKCFEMRFVVPLAWCLSLVLLAVGVCRVLSALVLMWLIGLVSCACYTCSKSLQKDWHSSYFKVSHFKSLCDFQSLASCASELTTPIIPLPWLW